MHIHSIRIRNFRRLKDVYINLAKDISIFVGANNSGKTSASHALQLFCGAARERFSIHDFSMHCWKSIDDFGERAENVTLPTISLDLWFDVDTSDVHRVVDLLPSLNWEGTQVGLRIEFSASDEAATLERFDEARTKARENSQPGQNGAPPYVPPPRTLKEYLTDNLRYEFGLTYFVLDRARFDDSFVPQADYIPLPLTTEKGRGAKDILSSLLRVDFLDAQRHLSDSAGGGRAEDLSRRLSRFYDRNLEKRGDDFETMRALSQSEAMFNEHLARVFAPTLDRLSALGYPGIANPQLLIKSALNPVTILASQDGTHIHYALSTSQDGVEPPTLPDRYNGLGFKNLIYMVVELLDLHAQWIDTDENRPLLHLIFIEEPEVHLHVQLQQVFIRQVLELVQLEGEEQEGYSTQLVVTTHSSHILYERGFRPLRYFRRMIDESEQWSEVINLSAFYSQTENPTRDFLERYLKLTHCDLFFADAAVLVEGNVERLLLPLMIERAAPRLKSTFLSIVEIGGAFGHLFRTLVEYLGLTVLIITDLDSVIGPNERRDDSNASDNPEESDNQNDTVGSACMANVVGAVSSNQTLIRWLPAKLSISELLSATDVQKTQVSNSHTGASIRVCYQTTVEVAWRGTTDTLAGRTLEEAFAFENLLLCQHADRAVLKLRIPRNTELSLDQLLKRLHKRINGTAFNKTDFALGLLSQDPNLWTVPKYIAQGLQWLETEMVPEIPIAEIDPIAEQNPA